MPLPSNDFFQDEAAAYRTLEGFLWPDGPVCPHCGNSERIYALKGKTTRIGLRKCGKCRKQFTVKVGTAFESSHIPLHKYLLALHLFTSSDKGASAHYLHRILGITYKSAWLLLRRMRGALRAGDLPSAGDNPRDASHCSSEEFSKVCLLYHRQFELTSRTPGLQDVHGSYTKDFSGAYFRDGQEQENDAAVSAAKSGDRPGRNEWVRERRVLATATAVDIAEEDFARAQVYSLLGAALTRPPGAEFLKRLGAIDGDASPLGQGFAALAAAARATAPEAAGEEFNALFIGMPQGEMTPYASYYMTGFMYEKPLARLRGDMARLGIEAADGVPEPEDHIGMLCEMMGALIEGRFAPPLGLGEQRKFFDAHLAPWAGRFFADLAAAKSARLYMPVGTVGRIFMDVESEAFAMA